MEINLTQDKYCGKKQCDHIYPDKVSRCGQPVYTENENLCYYHAKVRDKRICSPEESIFSKYYISFWSGMIMLMKEEK